MRLEELEVYNLAMDMGECVWRIVAGWNYFAKDTVGKQLVRAADSVAANLSEGFGRFHHGQGPARADENIVQVDRPPPGRENHLDGHSGGEAHLLLS